MHDNLNSRAAEAAGPILPGGKRIGEYVEEAGVMVYKRHVTAKHILRMTDAYTIGAGILKQLTDAGVVLLRYLSREGTYEIPLEEFLNRCSVLRGFAAGEDTYALSRHEWEFHPRLDQLALFAFEAIA